MQQLVRSQAGTVSRLSSVCFFNPPSISCCRTYANNQAHSGTYYDILGLNKDASQAQIKAAYYRLSKIYHPDVNKGANAQATFSAISEAHEVLGNKRNRRLYDQGMLNPLDLHQSDHSGTIDPEYKEFVNKKFRKRSSGPIFEKSHVYNFDEFYRQHYGESIRKNINIKNRENLMEQILKDRKTYHVTAGIYFVLLFTCFAFICSKLTGKDKS